jgi:hypothetical protein
MSPSPKLPEEKKLPDNENSSNDDLSHPEFHNQNEYNASTDESTHNSDDENSNNQNGYCLLPQESDVNQQQKQYDSEKEDDDDEFLRFATLRVQSSIDENKNSHLNNSSNEFIWSSKLESETFPVDDDKANYIKTRMSEIKLPESSIPIWAKYYSEEVWQEKLREKIISRQTTFFSNEKK